MLLVLSKRSHSSSRTLPRLLCPFTRHLHARPPDDKDVFSWTRTISTCLQQDQLAQAFQSFLDMQQQNVLPNSVTFLAMLSVCAADSALAYGKRLHAQIACNVCQTDCRTDADAISIAETALINMYGKCCSLWDAQGMFDGMALKDVVAWNAMITASCHCGEDLKAIQLFQHMRLQCQLPSKVTFVAVLEACANQACLQEGKYVHACTTIFGSEADLVFGTALVNMYGKCGMMKYAQWLFDSMPVRNVVSWTALMTVYIQCGHGEVAFQLFHQMCVEGVRPGRVTFLCMTEACSSKRKLDEGFRIHMYVSSSGLISNTMVLNALVKMYSTCGSLDLAHKTFLMICNKDVVSWTVMITAYVDHGHYRKALELFQHMNLQVSPDNATYIAALSACVSHLELDEGRLIHNHILTDRSESEVSTGISLIRMYGKCGSIEDARETFNQMSTRGTIAWNALIISYMHNGHNLVTLQIAQQMLLEGVIPNNATLSRILHACACSASLSEGMRLHATIAAIGCEHSEVVIDSLFRMYSRCGKLEAIKQLSNQHSRDDDEVWNAMILANAFHSSEKSLRHFWGMQAKGLTWSQIILVTTLCACANQGRLLDGIRIHASAAASSFNQDITFENALINMYGKCGCPKSALEIFNKMNRHDIVSWNTVIHASIQGGMSETALELLQQMFMECQMPDKVTFISILPACVDRASLLKGKRVHAVIAGSPFKCDVVIGTALIDMYGKCGSLSNASRVFDELPKYDIVIWNAMIWAYALNGEVKAALSLFYQMHPKALFSRYNTSPQKADGHAYKLSIPDGMHMNLNFDPSHNYSSECHNSLTDWFHDEETIKSDATNKPYHNLELNDVIPNDITFLSILFACSHAGLVHEGLDVFASMVWSYGVAPAVKHYNCMSDLLGRAGMLEEVELFLSTMASNKVAMPWMALLGACRLHLDVERGERAARHAYHLEPDNDVPYAMLFNLYATAHKWDDAAKQKLLMDQVIKRRCQKVLP